MTEEQKNRLEELLDGIRQAGEGFSLEMIDRNLARYNDFILHPKARIADIVDYESFREFRTEWKESGGIVNLPAEIASFNRYMSLVNQYNEIVIEELMKGNRVEKEYAPITYTEGELDIIRDSAMLYSRPFNWTVLKENLVGHAIRTAVYTHAVACLAPEDICQMIDDGEIRKETIEALPYAVSCRNINGRGDGINDRLLQEAYHSHLSLIYSNYGMNLPAPEVQEVGVRGVSFENHPAKLTYIIRKMNGGNGDIVGEDRNIGLKVPINLEKYVFHAESGDEPAIRVLASIPGDAAFQKVDIGNLPRDLAISISEKTPDATLVAELEEIGIATLSERDGSGSKRQPYAKLRLIMADRPVERERTSNRSREVEELFNMEDLK